MLNHSDIPRHIAIIMDGNGRWAKEKGLPRTLGHHAGIKRVKQIIKAASELKVGTVTLFAFSAENWVRPKGEISMLMRAMINFLQREIDEMVRNNVRLLVIGKDEPLPAYVLKKLKEAQARTKDNTGLTVVLALNYGSRQEIVDAAKKMAKAAIEGKVALKDINVDNFADFFYTAGIPDPDLLIRTSGEMRLSNFLLWQLSYSELYFPKKYWPDFDAEDLRTAIRAYQQRERRFGGVNAQK
ncbi:MAG: isoprenyl transferase [Deltaproteobacteria bacterium]